MSKAVNLNSQQDFAAYALGNGISKGIIQELKENDPSFQYRYRQYDNILVSAAAGSGKTAILVERIKNNIKHGIGIDRMLISTFTIEAAKNMRTRIEALLENSLENATKEETEKYKQAIRDINKAQISTLHSFCLDVIQKHYQKLGLSPKLRSLDEVERDVIVEQIIEEVLETYYEKANYALSQEIVDEASAAFLKLANLVSISGRDNLVDKIKTIMDVALASSRKEHLINDFNKDYVLTFEELQTNLNVKQRFIDLMLTHCNKMIELLETIKVDANKINKFVQTHEAFNNFDGEQDSDRLTLKQNVFNDIDEEIQNYSNTLSEEIESIKLLKNKLLSGSLYLSNDEINFNLPKTPAITKTKPTSLKAYLNTYVTDKDEILKFYKSIDKYRTNSSSRKKYSYYIKMQQSIQEMQDLNNELAQFVDVLTKITSEVMTKFAHYKKQHNLIDFSDYEHYTLQLLREHEDVRLYYHDLFKEIMIDEYQDFNRVQEAIINEIKAPTDDKNPTTVFMVGDVKQSIYQFRQADPELFNSKYANALDCDIECDSELDTSLYSIVSFDDEDKIDCNFINKKDIYNRNIVIELNKNYRSSQSVIDFTNNVFTKIMTEERGGIEYSGGHQLNRGRDGLGDYKCEVEIINSPDDKEKAVADYIVKTVENLKRREPSLNYSDITVLTSARTNHHFYNKALEDNGIQSVMNTRKGFLEALEVKVVLSVLRVLDNPLQDVDLLSMMRLPVFNLSVNDIAKIKDPDNYSHYLYSIFNFLNNEEEKDRSAILYSKLEHFKSTLYELRAYAKYHSVEQVLRKIYKDLEIEPFFMSMPMSYTRQANLTGLIDKAIEFNVQGHRSIHEFIVAMDHLKTRKKDFGEESFVSEDNAVKIMTIHASKGLEFKHVIYADVHTQFNFRSAGGRVVIDPTVGFGIDMPHAEVEYELYGYEKTFYNELVKEKMKQKMLGEELRKMYVAFTRAEESLHIPLILSEEKVDYESDDDDKTSNKSQGSAALFIHDFINAEDKDDLSTYLNILYNSQETIEEMEMQADSEGIEYKPTLLDKALQEIEEVKHKPNFHPGFKERDKTIQKVSVTELKRLSQELEAELQGAQPLNNKMNTFKKPVHRLKEIDSQNFATQIGTIVHEIMMRAVDSFEKGIDTDKLVDDAIRLTEEANGNISFLKDKNKNDAKNFFKNEVVMELLSDAELLTEQPFFADYSIVKDSHYKDQFLETHDGALFEGIIDLLIKKNDDWYVIIDYKTDKTETPHENKELLDKYKAQLHLYKAVVAQLTGAKRVDAYLYGFNYDEPFISVGKN
ncbi:UvrD-helicase domain-containing protein [Macrococcus armenti]|uniref:UvrD-helicase domain-containing protein n=1 Tax=Macrococcus armenti TaxID=2875764 RepID=UPI001CCA100C|nr:UvrD-helicase domain-containing protein [Macrococcus armenti]UBH09022.1 UvrD-helicase domain-containing protein [Macrococcus armenti]UBH11315.1 UvrD-helicase domain-containing protein [Macrococcus armenti]